MKIAFILPGRGSSGGVRTISIVAQGLQGQGHEVRLLHRKQKISFWSLGKAVRAKLLYRNAPDWIQEFKGSIDGFTNLSLCRFAPGEIIVSVGMAECAHLADLISLENPKVQYLHGSTPWAAATVDKALSLPFPKIVVASYLKDLVKSRGRAKDVLAIIHNGIDPREYFCSMPEWQRDGVGTIYGSHPAKDPETLLQVLDKLANLRPDVPVRVFSTDRRPRSIPSRFYWRSPTLSRAREIYSRSLVWIVGSRSEGFALPILEAMACGSVVVATDCGGPKDIIEDGVNGFLVPVGDARTIYSRVQLLLHDVDLRNQMRLRAQETLLRFKWDKCVRELERVLLTVAQGDDAVGIQTSIAESGVSTSCQSGVFTHEQ